MCINRLISLILDLLSKGDFDYTLGTVELDIPAYGASPDLAIYELAEIRFVLGVRSEGMKENIANLFCFAATIIYYTFLLAHGDLPNNMWSI